MNEKLEMAKSLLLITAGSGLLAVALGAFGAHGLKARIGEDLLAIYQTGVQYHFYHTFALGLTGLLMMQISSSWLQWAAYLFIAGILVFSGSLYVLAITGIRWLGAITPLGGGAFMLGWIALGIAVYQQAGK